LSFPLVLDQEGRINGLYGVVGLPSTFLIGRDGRVVALAVGPRDWEGATARTIIETMLAEPVSGPDSR
jgi:peroxiredoxin